MNLLEQKIAGVISASGPLTFERFMDMALYDSEHGYYMTGGTRIGREGDFYTSSHLHPAFGGVIAGQLIEMWEFMGRPRPFEVVEMGPGEGRLCFDIMNRLSSHDIFGSVKYCLVERNPLAIERQAALCRGFADRIRWISDISATAEVRGCFLSNELLDAMPVHLFEVGEDGLREVYVDLCESGFREKIGPPGTPEAAECLGEFLHLLPLGYRTEVNLRVRPWLSEIHRALSSGFLLTVDYGYSSRDYFAEDRNRGTLMCYREHTLSEDPLSDVGEKDITCHVNFSFLKKWGELAGFKTVGFSSQGAFLAGGGIEAEIGRLDPSSPDYPFELARIKKLVLPSGMGESHCVMLQYKGEGNPAPSCFSISNRMKYL